MSGINGKMGMMRADRLLAMLMLLQERGKLTAGELAAELEVSERTIYRDMDALSTAGIPVYAERGPGGGCALVESYRTDLTGLSQDEVRALFMLSVPAPLAELGYDHDLKAALLKLSAALPDPQRRVGFRTRQRIYLDASPWFPVAERPPHLRTIQRAVWEEHKVRMTYRLAFDAQVEHLIEPYGLVAKSHDWYLIFSIDGDIFVRKINDVLQARLTQDAFSIPADFDLVEFWTRWCQEYQSNQPQYLVRMRMHPDLLRYLHIVNDPIIQAIQTVDQPDSEDWQVVILKFDIFESARTRVLGFGGAVEVLEPEALRRSIQDFANQIIKTYHA
jgi:predicted DNA-binding transcriptional regulator YafY